MTFTFNKNQIIFEAETPYGTYVDAIYANEDIDDYILLEEAQKRIDAWIYIIEHPEKPFEEFYPGMYDIIEEVENGN